MASSSTSYLQTLPKDEAIVFLNSLQKVKDHLSEELEWMNQQVHQKTIQLQGIDILLAEAKAIGLTKLDLSSTTTPKTSETTSSKLPDTGVPTSESADDSHDGDSDGDFDDDSIDADDETVEETAEETVTAASPTADSPKKKTKSTPSAKKTKTASKPKAKGKQATTKGVELRELLQPTFRDKTFGDAVSEILERASQPLHVDELIDQMYNELSDQDYQRAKSSLANVLSVGSGKGRWKNVSKGMYAGNAVPASSNSRYPTA